MLGSPPDLSTSYSCVYGFASTSPGEILWISCGPLWVHLGCTFAGQGGTRYCVCQRKKVHREAASMYLWYQ